MPVRNEEAYIERSLRSVIAQDYPSAKMEIIIADGESDDGTLAIVRKLEKESDIPLVVVNNPGRIAPTGLNTAVSQAGGDVIIRVDGHCEIERDYVSKCVEKLTSGDADGVGGPIETIGETLRARAIAVAMSSRFGVGGSAFRTIGDREIFVDTVAFPGYRRKTLEESGQFNEELVRNQDDEMNYRIRKAGGKILLSPEIRSRYYSRAGFRALWRQYFQYGYWKVRVLQMHPRQMKARQFVPFLFVLSLILLTAVSIFEPLALYTLLMLIGIYLAANAAATIASAARIRTSSLLSVSLSFTMMHIAYGLGSLAGVLRFGHRWLGIKEMRARTVA